MVTCCDDSPRACVFAKALLAQQAGCHCATRRAVGERLLVECSVPAAHARCAALADLLHERARFALKLPAPGRPLMHAQALRLQCGGLIALQRTLGDPAANLRPEVHALLDHAEQQPGGLPALPWPALVAALVQWSPQRRRPPVA